MSISEDQTPNEPHSISDNDIGLRIKRAREAMKLSQIDMHTRTGLSRTVLINYEAGRHKPGAREIKLICDALQMSPNFLLYGTENPYSDKKDFAHSILSMGEGAFIPLSIIIPMLSAILGHDEKRLILELVETVIKAKSPELLSDIMSVLDACPKMSEIDIERAAEDSLGPEDAKRFMEFAKQKIASIPRK